MTVCGACEMECEDVKRGICRKTYSEKGCEDIGKSSQGNGSARVWRKAAGGDTKEKNRVKMSVRM